MSQTTVELNSTPRKAHKRTFLPRQIVVESYRSSESYLSVPESGIARKKRRRRNLTREGEKKKKKKKNEKPRP